MPIVRDKLTQYRSDRFTPVETLDFIAAWVLETEDILKDPLVGKTYTEELGKYKGISRIVVKRFRVYFKHDLNNIIIVALLFPGENKLIDLSKRDYNSSKKEHCSFFYANNLKRLPFVNTEEGIIAVKRKSLVSSILK